MLDKHRCGTCAYFFTDPNLEKTEMMDGLCRRFPPNLRPEQNEVQGHDKFPRVHSAWWCGEYSTVTFPKTKNLDYEPLRVILEAEVKKEYNLHRPEFEDRYRGGIQFALTALKELEEA